MRPAPAHYNDPDPDALSPCQACRLAHEIPTRNWPRLRKSRGFFVLVGRSDIARGQRKAEKLPADVLRQYRLALNDIANGLQADHVPVWVL